ncbi:MAG: single-stranded DNA-binding protein [Treponema sp.]|nr:single-stranded DNA-binding protein [Treponema sp.]
MNNLNSILIEGNLVKDPLLRSTPKGTHVCIMSLASNRYYKHDSNFQKEVSFFEIESWSRLAEACYNKGRKGRGVRIIGRLKQDRWNGADGRPHSKISIIAEQVEFRPEFKKDVRGEIPVNEPQALREDSSLDQDLSCDQNYFGDETGDPVLVMVEKEPELVTF